MSPDPGHEEAQVVSSAITWFVTERPTDGGTAFVKPSDRQNLGEEADQVPEQH